jgi:hydroxymethylpyrimidine pyrophosphatase-like HAD family hydrolase
MFCRLFACDFDGTTAENGRLAPEVAAAIEAARAKGYVVILVTGRVHDDVEMLCADLSVFDAIVAENGAVVCLPADERTIHLATPPPDQLLAQLRSAGIPFHTGSIIVGTWKRYATRVLELVSRTGVDVQLIFNREALMMLPSGINKAVGVRRALDELGRSEHNLIAFGDAENDLPLLNMAAIGVAAAGSVPAVAAQADEQLSRKDGSSVARYIQRVLDADGFVPTPPRHRIDLGADAEERPVFLPATTRNVMISGDPRSGKSWLAGLIAEQIIERGYRLCVIDPEGDYFSLASRPRTLALGREVSLARPTDLPRLLRNESLNLVLELTELPFAEQQRYVDEAIRELTAYARETGTPHWILVDEAHYFFNEPSSAERLRGPIQYLFTTYRPNLVADDVYATISAHLITRTTEEAERYFISSLLKSRGPRDLVVAEALAELDIPRAGLLLELADGPRWFVFTPRSRVTLHAHHARKYSDTRLPDAQAFYFRDTGWSPPPAAHNVAEFYEQLQAIPETSLRHHLKHGDFSRWAAQVIGDESLARGFRKLEQRVQVGEEIDRGQLRGQIEDHYLMA